MAQEARSTLIETGKAGDADWIDRVEALRLATEQ
jgi:hypothetical protein